MPTSTPFTSTPTRNQPVVVPASVAALYAPQLSKQAGGTAEPLKAVPSGSVTVEGATYSGTAVVPGTGGQQAQQVSKALAASQAGYPGKPLYLSPSGDFITPYTAPISTSQTTQNIPQAAPPVAKSVQTIPYENVVMPVTGQEQFMKFTPLQKFYTSPVTQKIAEAVSGLVPGFTRAEKSEQLGYKPVYQNIPTKSTISYTEKGAYDYTPQQSYKLGLLDQKQFLEAEAKYQLPATFGTGVAYGAISVLAPPVGLTLGGLSITKAALQAPEIIEVTKISPTATAINVGAGIAGGAVGAIGTAYIVPKIQGIFSTAGRTEVPIEKISSQEPYPKAPVSQHLTEFTQSQYGLPGETQIGVYHATPYGKAFGETFTVTKGSSELPGLYVAPEVSYKFLKIGGTEIPVPKFFDLSTTSILERQPAILRIYPTNIQEAPTFGNIPATTEFLTTTAEKGVAYVPGIKTEIEAVIPPESTFALSGKNFYTSFAGVKVPIQQYIPSGEVGSIPTSELGGYIPIYPITTPGSIGYSISRTSAGYQILSSNLPSAISLSKISASTIPSPVSNVPSRTSSRLINFPYVSYSYMPSTIPSSTAPSSIVSPVIPSVISGTSTSSVTTIPSPPVFPETLIPPIFELPGSQKKRSRGYRIFVIKKGKQLFLPGLFTRREALIRGEKVTLSTLRATFGIKESGTLPTEDMGTYEPSRAFRQFVFRKGKKIAIENLYIEKAGTKREPSPIKGARLVSPGARREINLARLARAKIL